MRLAIVLVAVAVAAAASSAAADSKLPALYAALFDKGHTWTYAVTLTKSDEAPARTTKSVVTCTVAEVADLKAAGVASRITCTPHVDAVFIDHVYLATADGLRELAHADKLPTAADVGDAGGPVIMPAAPKAFRTVTTETAVNPKGVVIEGLRADGTGWCSFSDSSTADPDGAIASQCFAPGIGIASGDFRSMNNGYQIVYKLAAKK